MPIDPPGEAIGFAIPIPDRGPVAREPSEYELLIFYTHSAGEAIERLYRAVDEGVQGLVMNPAAFLFAAYALRDCLRAVPIPLSRSI